MKSILVLTVFFSLTPAADAQLTPDEVAVVAMAQSAQSRSLAEYYAKSRGVPKSQILLLLGEPRAPINWAAWQSEIRPAIRAWLLENNLQEKIRCFVSSWDVPLRIGRRDTDAPEVLARSALLARSRAVLVEKLDEVIETLNSVGPVEKQPPVAPQYQIAQGVESADIEA